MSYKTPFGRARSGDPRTPPFTGLSAVSAISSGQGEERLFWDGGRRDSGVNGSMLDVGDRASGGGSGSSDYFGLREPFQSSNRFKYSPSSGAKKRPRPALGAASSSSSLISTHESNEWHQKYLSAQREVVQLRRAAEDDRDRNSRKMQQLERELHVERARVEQKDVEVQRSSEAEEACRHRLRDMELAFMREKHELTDNITKQEKAFRRLTAQTEEESQLLKSQVSELTTEIAYGRRVAEEKDLIISQLQEELARIRDDKRANDAADLRIQIESLSSLSRRLEGEKKDLLLQVEALRHGVAMDGRAADLSRELSMCNQQKSSLKKQTLVMEQELSAQRESGAKSEILEARLKELTNQRQGLLAVEAERDALTKEKEEWTSLFKEIIGKMKSTGGATQEQLNPIQALRLLLETENSCRLLAKQKADLEVSQTQLKVSLVKEQEASRAAGKARFELQERCAQLEEKLDQSEGRQIYLGKERDSLLRVMSAVDNESFATLPKDQQEAAALKVLKQQREKDVAALKDSLTAANARINDLERLLAEARSNGMSPAVLRSKSAQVESQQAKVDELLKENKRLAESLEKALNKVAELEHQVNSGMFNPNETKILHLAINPERKAIGVGQDAPAAGPAAPAPSETSDGKRHQRLIKAFKETTSAFKEAVYLLTGYKIDMMDKESPAVLRLRSVFAERPNDELLFRWNRDGSGRGSGLELLETPFARDNLDENTLAYLTKCNSVPAFLGTLTLDLFSKQTLAI